MNYSFEYIDIILLAMIAGFIFLRLRGILGRRTGHEENINSRLSEEFTNEPQLKKQKKEFDEDEKKKFIVGAKIAYENIITDFASGNLKNIKHLLGEKVYENFNEALKERGEKGIKSETTFIGINSATIKEHKKVGNFLEVTVEFVSEIISCMKDKDKKVLSGNPDRIKKVMDIWIFSRNMKSLSPNWLLIDTQN